MQNPRSRSAKPGKRHQPVYAPAKDTEERPPHARNPPTCSATRVRTALRIVSGGHNNTQAHDSTRAQLHSRHTATPALGKRQERLHHDRPRGYVPATHPRKFQGNVHLNKPAPPQPVEKPGCRRTIDPVHPRRAGKKPDRTRDTRRANLPGIRGQPRNQLTQSQPLGLQRGKSSTPRSQIRQVQREKIRQARGRIAGLLRTFNN